MCGLIRSIGRHTVSPQISVQYPGVALDENFATTDATVTVTVFNFNFPVSEAGA